MGEAQRVLIKLRSVVGLLQRWVLNAQQEAQRYALYVCVCV